MQFRALSDQLYRSAEHHGFVRQQIVQQVRSVLLHAFRLNLTLLLSLLHNLSAFEYSPSFWCNQLKGHPEMYEGYVPMGYVEYLKKMSRYYSFPLWLWFPSEGYNMIFALINFGVDDTGVVNGVIMLHCKRLQIGCGAKNFFIFPFLSVIFASHRNMWV